MEISDILIMLLLMTASVISAILFHTTVDSNTGSIFGFVMMLYGISIGAMMK